MTREMEYKVVEGENNRECEEDGSVDPALLPLSPTKLLEVTSPTSKKSPLVFLKKRVAKTSSGKKRRESGQSGDGVEAEHDEPGAISPTTGNVVSPVRSPSFEHQQAGKEKPQRKGIAKVFHDLRFRSRVRKSQSAPSASAMESTPISGAPSQTSMDDDSFSSYATPAEAVSSGYSTPMYGSNLASPEASMSQAESYVEEEEEGDVTAVGESLDQQSPSKAASALLASSRSPASSPNDAFRASPSSRSSSALVETSPVSLERSSAKPAAAAAAETEHVVRTETLANPVVLEKSSGSCASSKEDYRRAETTSSSPSSATIPASPLKSEQTVAQATSTIPRPSPETVLSKSSPSTKPTKEAPSESELRQRKIEKAEAKPLGEIRFYFTEHCPNNNQSPQRGLMRSLPGDGKMEASHPGHDANGYPKNEHLYKVLVIGELGTGKTSIIKRYVHQFFSQHYRATIGVDFALKVVHWDQNTVIRLQLWDIAGQERFGNMTRVYYKEAVGAFIVFDVTRQSTFESVTKWKQDLDAKVQLPDGSPIPCVLLANKCDQPKEGIAANPAKLDEYCREKGFAGWFETSAKDNINIDDAAKFLVGTILQNDQWSTSIKEEDPDRLDLNGKGAPGDEHKKSTCC